jgi:hypothetical protein
LTANLPLTYATTCEARIPVRVAGFAGMGGSFRRNTHRVDALGAQLPRSTAVRVIHKEDRDIEEQPEVPFVEVRSRLEKAGLEFRGLNRALRKASFAVEVEFLDEDSSKIVWETGGKSELSGYGG